MMNKAFFWKIRMKRIKGNEKNLGHVERMRRIWMRNFKEKFNEVIKNEKINIMNILNFKDSILEF